MPSSRVVMHAEALSCALGQGRKKTVAVDRVSFEINRGEIASVVGESGAGKSTLARMLLGLKRETSGVLTVFGDPIKSLQSHFQKVQGVFQDPFAAFNPFFSIRTHLLESFSLFDSPPSADEKQRQIRSAIEQVGLLPNEIIDKRPFELSGGQLQRVLLARIFILEPQILVADEPTSMVDACSRITVLDGLLDLKEKKDMTIVFITHDLGLAAYVSDQILVMKDGKIVEQGPRDDVMNHPSHEYTKALLSCLP